MSTAVYKLYGSVVTDTDNAAAIDIRADGHIVGVSLDMDVVAADALGDGGQAEVSFASTNGFLANDTTASIAHIRASQQFLTSGGGPVAARTVIAGIAIPVFAGERMYLHIDILAAPTSVAAVAYVYVEEGNVAPNTRRMRRRL